MIQVLDKDGNGTDLNLNLDLEDADNDNESVANMGQQDQANGQFDKVSSGDSAEMKADLNSGTTDKFKFAVAPDPEMRIYNIFCYNFPT